MSYNDLKYAKGRVSPQMEAEINAIYKAPRPLRRRLQRHLVAGLTLVEALAKEGFKATK